MLRLLIALALSAFLVHPAAAQVKSPFASGIAFTEADVGAILAATQPFFESDPPELGTQRSWNNPESGLSGTARYEGQNEANGRPCRQIHHIILNQKTDKTYEFRVDRCKADDGTWQMVASAWMAG